MNSSVRINVRVMMGNALAQFERLTTQMRMLDAAAAKSAGSSSRFGTAWGSAFKEIELAGKRLTQTARILIYNFTLPLTLAAGGLVREFAKVDKNLAVLSQVYETASGSAKVFGQANAEVDRDLASLNKIALALSNGFGVARSEVTDLMVTFGRAGASGVQLARYTEVALSTMKAFGATAKEASDAVITAAVSYGLVGNQVNVAMAMLGFAANKTRSDVSGLSAGFVKAAPTAQQLGIDIAHLTAWLAAMSQAGFTGKEAGTALNFGFTRLVKATPEAIKLFKQVGLNIEGASFAAANGTQRLNMVRDALKDLTGTQRAYAIAVMFGVRQQPKFTALLADMLKTGGLVDQLLKSMANSEELLAYTDNQLLLSLNNTSDKFAILKTQLVNNLMAIAVMLTPVLLSIVQVIEAVTRKFAELGNTASGRQKQAWIVFGLAVLAAIGPLSLVIASITTLIGFLGHMVTVLGPLAAALASPWTIVVGALVALLVFSRQFRDAFVNIFVGLYRGILRVAQLIYEALQWLNPFARHSPSLVESTREGVAAMVGYWRNLSPVLTIVDKASRQVVDFRRNMERLGLSAEAAAKAKARSDIAFAGGPGALSQYDALVATNVRLEGSLRDINAQYESQAKVVAQSERAMAKNEAEVSRAESSLDQLRKKSDLLSKQLDRLGDPAALRSQAVAASSMARRLAEAGKTDLASQFGEQAKAMEDQARKAEQVQSQLDNVATAIQAEENRIAALRAEREKLQGVLDRERTRLDSLETGYRSVETAIRDNTSAMQDATSQAAAMRSEMEAAAKAAAKVKDKRDPFAQFDAAGTADLPSVLGENAVPKGLPKDTGQNLDSYLADLQKRTAERMRNLFPNPFGPIRSFFDKFKGAWDKGKGALTTSLRGVNLSGGFGAGMADWAKPIGEAVDRARARFRGLFDSVQPMAERLRKAWEGIGDTLTKFGERVGPPLERFRAVAAQALGVIIDVGSDIIRIVGGGVMVVLGKLADFWATNGAAIGNVVGVIVGLFVDFFAILLRISTWLVKVLWPSLKTGLEAVMQIIGGVIDVFAGLFQFIIQIFNGNFSKAWQGLLQMFRGLKDVAVGALKILAVAVLGLIGRLVVGILSFFGGLGSKIASKLPAVAGAMLGFFAGLPAQLWGVFVTALGLAWDLVGLIAGHIPGWIAGVSGFFAGFAQSVVQILWDALKLAVTSLVKLDQFLGTKIIEWTVSAGKAMADFGRSLPGRLWEGIQAVWSAAVPVIPFIVTKIAEWSSRGLILMLEFGKNIPRRLWEGIKAIWDGTVQFVGFVSGKIAQYTPAILAKILELGKSIPGKIWEGLVSIWGATIKFSEWVVGKIGEASRSITGKATELGKGIVTAIGDAIRTTLRSGLDLIGRLTGALNDAIDWAVNGFKNLGAWLIQGIINGIVGAGSRVKDAVVDKVKDAYNGALRFLGISSPSKLMRDMVGKPMVEGIAWGVERDGHMVTDSLVQSAESAYQALVGMKAMSLTMPELVQNVRLNYLNSPMSTVGNATGGLTPDALAPGGAVVYNRTQNINVDAHSAEVNDPFAFASAVAFASRNEF